MPSGVEQGRYSTPVAPKHLNNKEDTLTKQDEVDPEGASPPPLAAPLSDDTLDASAEKEPASKNYQQQRSGISDIDCSPIDNSPFVATPSPIGDRTVNDDTIDGTFDTDTGVGISRTLNISEIDESLLNNNTNSTATNGESSAFGRRNSTSNDTTNNTLKSILELSEIDTTLDGAALNRTIGATDASASAPYRAPRQWRDLSEIDVTMDRIPGDAASTGNAGSIQESKLQAELAADASERMQRMLEEATSGGSSTGGATDVGGDESTLAGQAFVGGGGSGASVITSGSTSYSIGGNAAATSGTDIAEFLRKQNEAMQRALAGAGVGEGGGGDSAKIETIVSPTKTRAVDTAVENARIMAEATAKLSPTNDESSSPEVKRTSSMEFGSQSHLNVGATGRFTTNDTTGTVSVTVQSASRSISKSTLAKTSSAYESQYALSPSQRAQESMTVAEKIRQAEAEAMARDGGPRFEKMSAVSEMDDDYVPIADFSTSSAKKKKAVGSFDYNDYSPDNQMTSPDGSAVQRYRIMRRRQKRRRQRRMIRTGLVALVIAAILFCWHRSGSGGESDANDSEGQVEAVNHIIVDDLGMEEAEQQTSNDDDVEKEGTGATDEYVVTEEEQSDGASSLASAFAREKIRLVNADQAPIVKLFQGTKTAVSNINPRAIPFSHFWNKQVRDNAQSQPVLSGIDELLDCMMQ